MKISNDGKKARNKPRNTPRNRPVAVRFSQREYNQLQKRAAKEGLPVALLLYATVKKELINDTPSK